MFGWDLLIDDLIWVVSVVRLQYQLIPFMVDLFLFVSTCISWYR